MTDEAKQELKDDLVIREEADGSAIVEVPGEDKLVDEDGDEKHVTKDEDEEEEELELTGTETDDEREKIRERRRVERQHRKTSRKEKEDSLRRQIESERQARLAVEERLNLIERKNTGSEIAQLDTAIKESVNAYNYYKEQISIAVQAGKGDIVADATEKMMSARMHAEHLTRVKQSFTTQQAAPRPLDPRLINHAQTWMGDNKWYDPSGKDSDSRILLTLDDGLAAENWDPTSKEYWEELTTRAKKYLPHRFAQDPNPRPKPKNVITGGNQETSSAVRGGYTLSAERVQALKDSGAWENPEKRNKMIAKYREYDRKNRG